MIQEQFAVITGAAKGLGRAMAINLAKRGSNIILISLPGENLNVLASQLAFQFAIKAVPFELDITAPEQIATVCEEISRNYQIYFLINNAGIGGTSSFTQTSVETLQSIIDVNISAMTNITSRLLPNLLKAEKSYILNIASMAAFAPIAYKTVYPASKAFIASFSLGLREELKDTCISVSVAFPGPIMTNSKVSERIIAHGRKARFGLLTTDEIARLAIKNCLAKKGSIIPGLWNFLSAKLMQLLPKQTSLRIVSRTVKKELQFNF